MGSLAYWERKLQALDHYVGIKYVLQSLEDKSMQVEITILAAGIGSRMRSNKPKVLQTLAGRTLLDYILAAADSLNPSAIHIVVGQGADMVRAAVSDRSDVNCVDQADRLGTGHAMQQVASHLQDDSRVLMLLGDCPLIHPSTLRELCETPADLAILTVKMADSFGYGRILRADNGQVQAIVEEKDANDTEKGIKEIKLLKLTFFLISI